MTTQKISNTLSTSANSALKTPNTVPQNNSCLGWALRLQPTSEYCFNESASLELQHILRHNPHALLTVLTLYRCTFYGGTPLIHNSGGKTKMYRSPSVTGVLPSWTHRTIPQLWMLSKNLSMTINKACSPGLDMRIGMYRHSCGKRRSKQRVSGKLSARFTIPRRSKMRYIS